MNSNDHHLSKSLSWLLRHGAENQGLKLSPDGYLPVKDILNLRQFNNYSLNDLTRVVENNDKKRFTSRTNAHGMIEIRANQGHTIKVEDKELLTQLKQPENCPQEVIHGTYLKNWESIKKEGLSRINRNHIHFAKGLPNDVNVISGIRRNCEVYIYLNVKKALSDGLKLYESENGVILCPGNENGFITPDYFLKIVKK